MSQQFQTRDQRVACSVYKLIQDRKFTQKSDESDQYGGMASKLPVLIRTAGLAQALAYAEARGTKKGQKALLEDLREQLGWPAEPLSVHASSLPLPAYMRQTREALAALLWFKRYAQSVLAYEPGAEESAGPGDAL